jgi:PadR family transcriptional regulator PadR
MDVECLLVMREPYQNRIELLQGTLDMIILQTLCWGPQHGYAISQAIRAGSGDVLQVETGSLYPALHRLQRRGWLKSEWKQSENKQLTKVYSLTANGKKQLAAERERWNRMTIAIAGLMNTKESNA